MENQVQDTILSWRNHQRVRFIKGFYQMKRLVEELCRHYQQTGEISHDTINSLLETHLRELKDLSHVLYRLPDDEQVDRRQQRLFDKILSEMWHELDKARDNVRILEAYSDYAAPDANGLDEEITQLDHQIKDSARSDLPLQIKRAKEILNRLVPLFEKILPIYRTNEVVFRSLFFARAEFEGLCPPCALDYFFGHLFQSVEEGYAALIRSLLSTKHYVEAKNAIEEFRGWVSNHPDAQPLFASLEAEVSALQK